jgi:hypothetical protein
LTKAATLAVTIRQAARLDAAAMLTLALLLAIRILIGP